MRFVMFYHSLVSDWNHGNAHFLRGIASELLSRGHEVAIFEPSDSWSRRELLRDHGLAPLDEFARVYPQLSSRTYDPATVDLDEATRGADVVLVHEWSSPRLVERLGRHRRHGHRYRLLFHDTHHRMATAPDEMSRYDLSGFDGVLAYGAVLSRLYERRGLRAWTWHEAADTRIFRPVARRGDFQGDVVWIGNWGDGERSREIFETLLEPVARLGLRARVYGVRYPADALRALEKAGIEYGGWLPNHEVPSVFSKYRLTVHIPRAAYRRELPGIPTIRVFEALACGIPLVCLRWPDSEALFEPGSDYLEAEDSDEMARAMSLLVGDDRERDRLARHGLATITARHTCAHRVDELVGIARQIEPDDGAVRRGARPVRPRREEALG